MNKLVSYSSSSSSEDEPSHKKIKLPIPFKSSIDENYDDPLKHQGRKRQIPHVAGNWSCHVFIDCCHLKDVLCDYLNIIKKKYSKIELIDAPHVSLSKNFIIKYHWIENLSKVLAENLKFNSFELKFSVSNIKFLSNEDKSRHFACILVNESCQNDLEKLINGSNKSLKEFKLPPYYENLIFHASILWKLEEYSEDEKEFIRSEIYKFVQNEYVLNTIVERITFKTGNKIKMFNSQ